MVLQNIIEWTAQVYLNGNGRNSGWDELLTKIKSEISS